MSQLESASKPLLGLMLHDVASPIDILQQDTLSRWAVKTAMVMESTANDIYPFYTRQEREQLRLSSKIPDNTAIWLARYTGNNDLAFAGMHLWNDEPERPETIHCYVNTIVFGYVAIQTFTAHLPAGHPTIKIPATPGVPWDSLLIRVWPTGTRTVRWPPNMTFSDTGGIIALGDLVERFKPTTAASM
jgi:hypothetical protein